MLRGARREPIEVAYVLVQCGLVVLPFVDIARGGEEWALDDAPDRALVDAADARGCDARSVARARDAVDVPKRAHRISSGNSITTARSPSSGIADICARAAAFLCSR